MDFSSFSDEHFNAKAWVNKALKAGAPDPPARGAPLKTAEDQRQMLVMRLQTFIQKVNSELEDTSRTIVSDLPSVIRSIDVVQQEVLSLKERMSLVKQDIETVEKETAHSMSLLVQLDQVKSRMEATSGALQEADNWTTLSSDVEEAFEAEDVKKIASTLLGMQRSLMVLSDVPDYNDRKIRLAALQNRLEAIITPRLVAAFAAHNYEVAKDCMVIFEDMGRKPQLVSTYTRTQKAPILKEWAALMDDDGRAHLPARAAEFYSRLLQLWTTETAWCEQVFPALPEVPEQLLVDIVTQLSPALSDVLNSHCGTGEEQLARLLQCFEATLEFARGLKSMSTPLLEAVFEPFSHFQIDYAQLQRRQLEQRLESLPTLAPGEGHDWDEAIEALGKHVPALIRLLEGAADSCMAFTGGSGAPGLSLAISEHVGHFVTRLCKDIAAYEKGLEELGRKDSLGAADEEVWTRFQSTFRLIHVCGDLLKRCFAFEEQLRDRVLARKEFLSWPWPDSLQATQVSDIAYNYLRDRPRPRAALMGFVEQLEKGHPMMPEVADSLRRLGSAAHGVAFRIGLLPVQHQLQGFLSNPAWSTNDGAAVASVAPLPYVRKIGEHMLTLPQQLEPFLEEGSPVAFALQHSVLPHSKGNLSAAPGEDVLPIDVWLRAVANGVMADYLATILRLPALSFFGGVQLSADIEFLFNVLSALDVACSAELSQANQLLGVPPAEFEQYAATMEMVDPAISHGIATIRGLVAPAK